MHATGVEPVHGLVKDQQLRIAEQARGDPESLAHAHRVLGHAVVSAGGHPYSFEGRSDPLARGGFSSGGQDLKVLSPGEMGVESWLIDDGAHARERDVTVSRYLVAE